MKEENNCRAEAQEPKDGQKSLNIPVLVGAGGAGLLFTLILTAVLLKVRRNRSEDKAEEKERRTDSDNRIQDFELPGWAEQDKEECSTYMNKKGVEGSAVAMNGNRDVVTFKYKERFNKQDVYVEALAVRKVEDFGIYVRAECVKRVDYVCGEASAVGKEEEFGSYMNEGRAKNESVYVEASVVEGREGFGTYMNAERAKNEDVYVEASVVKEEGFGTHMNAGRAKKEYAYVQASVVKGEEDFGMYINTKIAQKELPLVKDQSLEENEILGQT